MTGSRSSSTRASAARSWRSATRCSTWPAADDCCRATMALRMFDHATAAVEAALNAGARYADARVMSRRTESMDARNGEVEDLTQAEDSGIGVRALIGSGWGFYATAELTPQA